jgi:class 3 adenylate cyclase
MDNKTITVKKQVVLFTDIHDFSIIANILKENQYSFLQEVYEKLGDIIVAYQGEIIKYMGDGILYLFPADSENEVVKCALELRKAFGDIVNTRNIRHDTELEIGIGSGEVGVGLFGHKSLRQKDVFGEEVNRVVVIGHHRGIAITENVYDKIRTDYKTGRLPEFSVKWQTEPLRVWEIIE